MAIPKQVAKKIEEIEKLEQQLAGEAEQAVEVEQEAAPSEEPAVEPVVEEAEQQGVEENQFLSLNLYRRLSQKILMKILLCGNRSTRPYKVCTTKRFHNFILR